MTHEPGSKMASEHACIILHIQVSADTVLLNTLAALAWPLGRGGAGKAEGSIHPQRDLTWVSIASLPAWPSRGRALGSQQQPVTCSSPGWRQAGQLGERLSGGVFFLFLLLQKAQPVEEDMGLLSTSCFPGTNWTKGEGEPDFGKSCAWSYSSEAETPLGQWRCSSDMVQWDPPPLLMDQQIKRLNIKSFYLFVCLSVVSDGTCFKADFWGVLLIASVEKWRAGEWKASTWTCSQVSAQGFHLSGGDLQTVFSWSEAGQLTARVMGGSFDGLR